MGGSNSKYSQHDLTSYLGNPLAIAGPEHTHTQPAPLRCTISNTVTDASGLILYHIDRQIGSTTWSITITNALGDPVLAMSTKVGGLLAEKFSVTLGATNAPAMKVVGHKHMNSYEFEVALASGDALTVKINVSSEPGVYVFTGHPKSGGYLIARSSLGMVRGLSTPGGAIRAEIAPGVDVPAMAMLVALAEEVVSALRRTGRAARRHGH